MSAEIIPFLPRTRRQHDPRDISHLFRTRTQADDLVMVGRESAGVPDAVHASVDASVRIPMQPGMRSINVAVAGAMVIGEALRQTSGFFLSPAA